MAKKVSKKSKRRLMTLGLISIIAIGYFLITIIGYTYNYISLKNEENTLKEELSTLQEEKSDLKTEIIKLSDPEYLIRYAKENFLYSGDGEYVIKLDDNKIISNEEIKKDNTIYIIAGSVLIFIGILIIIKKKSSK